MQCLSVSSCFTPYLVSISVFAFFSFLFKERESEGGGGGIFHTTSFTFCFRAVKINCSPILNIFPLLLYKTDDVIFPRSQDLQPTSLSPPSPIPQPPPRQPCDTNTCASNYRQYYTPFLSFITRLIFSSFERGLSLLQCF